MPCSCRVLVTGGDWAELGGRTVLAGSWTALPAGPLHQASRCQWCSPGGGGVCLLPSGTPVGFHVPFPFFTGVECTEADCLRGGVNLKLVSFQWLVATTLRRFCGNFICSKARLISSSLGSSGRSTTMTLYRSCAVTRDAYHCLCRRAQYIRRSFWPICFHAPFQFAEAETTMLIWQCLFGGGTGEGR